MHFLKSKKILVVIALILIAAILGVKRLQTPKTSEISSLDADKLEFLQKDVFKLHKSDLQSKVSFSGVTRPSIEGVVSAPISGFIKNVYADVGNTVKKGQLLVAFIDTRYKAEYEDKKSQLEAGKVLLLEAKQKLTYNENLYAKQSTSNESVRQAKFAMQHQEQLVKSLEAQTYLAKRMYDQTSLYSPIDGVVSWREVNIGQSISEGKDLLKVISIKPLEAIADVQSNDIARIKVGQSVEVTPPGEKNTVVQGVVTRISPTAQDVTHVHSVYIKIDNASESLQSGMFVDGSIIVSDQKDVLVIDKKWLSHIDNTSAVVFMVDNAKIKEQKITIKQVSHDVSTYLIEGGINDNTIVINPALSDVSVGKAISIHAE